MGLVYRPDHPQANENGMIDRQLAFAHIDHGEAAYVISDEMPPTRHMCDGHHYTSKAKFRAATKAHGCIEVGNETATLLKPKPDSYRKGDIKTDIRRAMWELRNGRRA